MFTLACFYRFFEDYPDNQNFFPDFRGRALEELRECPSLQQHGLRVMGALTSIVDSIDDAGVLVGVLHRTVDSHLTRGVRAAQFAVTALLPRLGRDSLTGHTLSKMYEASLANFLLWRSSLNTRKHHTLDSVCSVKKVQELRYFIMRIQYSDSSFHYNFNEETSIHSRSKQLFLNIIFISTYLFSEKTNIKSIDRDKFDGQRAHTTPKKALWDYDESFIINTGTKV